MFQHMVESRHRLVGVLGGNSSRNDSGRDGMFQGTLAMMAYAG